MRSAGLRWTGKAPAAGGGRQEVEERGEGDGGGKAWQGGGARDGAPGGRE